MAEAAPPGRARRPPRRAPRFGRRAHRQRARADGYATTSLADYVAAYERYVEAMLESQDAADRAGFQTNLRLSASLDGIAYEPTSDPRYRLIQSAQPTVAVGPLTLHFDAARGQLCTNVMSKLYFGLELAYPRVVSYAHENHERLHDTTGLAAHDLFMNLRSRILEQTAPCTIQSSARQHRTAIRITAGMRERMKQHPGLRALELRL